MNPKEIKARAGILIVARAAAHLIYSGSASDKEAVAEILCPAFLELHWDISGDVGQESEYVFQYRIWKQIRPNGMKDFAEIRKTSRLTPTPEK